MDAVSTSATAMDAVSASNLARTAAFASDFVYDTIWNGQMPSETIWNNGGTVSLGADATQSLVSGRLGDSQAIQFSDNGGNGQTAEWQTTLDFTNADNLVVYTQTNGDSLGFDRYFYINVDGTEIANIKSGNTSWTERSFDVSSYSGSLQLDLGAEVQYGRKFRYASVELV